MVYGLSLVRGFRALSDAALWVQSPRLKRRRVGRDGSWVWSTAFAKRAMSTIDAPRINLTCAETLIGALVLLWLHPRRLLGPGAARASGQ